jgi:tetratricopeptide (TPR) repeat protein
VTSADSEFTARVTAELQRWNEISTRPPITFKSADLLAANPKTQAEIAGADVVIRTQTSQAGDSVRWAFTVFDARTPLVYRIARTRPRATGLEPDTLMEMVARALVGAKADSAPGFANLRQRSFVAARSYADGWHLLRSGAFDDARKAFSVAAQAVPTFANARWWSAQIGAFTAPTRPEAWRDDAATARALAHSSSGTDSVLIEALYALATDPPSACDKYRIAAANTPNSFTAWYGLGLCQEIDSAVVRDARAPGGWRFRSSHWGAVSAYEKALEQLPSEGMAALFTRVVPLTYASGNRVRSGVALPPDTSRFLAIPSLAGDSLELLPMSRSELVRTSAVPESFSRALQRVRRRLLEFTERWVVRAPTSATAWFYRAYALELVGAFDAPDDLNSAALSLRRADSLNTDPDRRAGIDIARVRVAVRRGKFAEATKLARTAIARSGPLTPQVAGVRAPLAAFIGDVDVTSRLLRVAATPTHEAERRRLPPWAAASLPPWLADSLRAFGVRAIIGACDDLAVRREGLENDLRRHVAAADLAETRRLLLRDAYRAAVPCLGPSVLREFPPENPLDEAIAALDVGDRRRSLDILDRLQQTRRGVSVATVSEDALYAEAWVRTAAGDTAGARVLLRANMNDLASISAFTFDEVAQAAALTQIHRSVFGRQ